MYLFLLFQSSLFCVFLLHHLQFLRASWVDNKVITSNLQCTVYSVQFSVYSVQCTVYSVKYTVYSVQLTVFSVRCTVYTIHCEVYMWYSSLVQAKWFNSTLYNCLFFSPKIYFLCQNFNQRNFPTNSLELPFITAG